MVDEDDNYVYFESETPGFSPFAIASEEQLAGSAGENSFMFPDDADPDIPADVNTVENPVSSSGISVVGILVMLGFISVLLAGEYFIYRRQG